MNKTKMTNNNLLQTAIELIGQLPIEIQSKFPYEYADIEGWKIRIYRGNLMIYGDNISVIFYEETYNKEEKTSDAILTALIADLERHLEKQKEIELVKVESLYLCKDSNGTQKGVLLLMKNGGVWRGRTFNEIMPYNEFIEKEISLGHKNRILLWRSPCCNEPMTLKDDSIDTYVCKKCGRRLMHENFVLKEVELGKGEE